MIKLGSWGGSEQRKELSLVAKKGEFDKLVQIFGALGLTKGAVVITKTSVYKYKGLEFAVVDVCGRRYIFEAEIMVKNKKDVEKAQHKIDSVLKELGLEIYTNEEFYKYIEDLNKKKIAKIFNYKTYKENYFKKKYGL
jgi:adenylate cyclase class IV